MSGRAKRKSHGTPRRGDMEKTEEVLELEVAPTLPTSGQILGVLVRSLGIRHPKLQDRTASRYFSGRLEERVKESSRAEIIEAVADALVEVGLFMAPQGRAAGSSASSDIVNIIDWHASTWDWTRSFLRPRMARVLPSHLAEVWRTYFRLTVIDLSLRVAAHIHLTGTSPAALDFLEAANMERRGRYLNDKRKEVGVTLNCLVNSAGWSRNTVDAWLYKGVRPSDDNLVRIVSTLSQSSDPCESDRILQELRRLYWASDLAKILEDLIGPDDVRDLLSHLRRYTSQLYSIVKDETTENSRLSYLTDLSNFGGRSQFSEPMLTTLASQETDDEWKEDILAAGTDWTRRVLEVNLQVHQAEEDELIESTDGRILDSWDVSNPEAYAHYQRSMELQLQGRLDEAIAEVTQAVKLDPLDPANHFTLGSAKGTIGVKTGDETLIDEALKSCWLSATLDPKWILPWAEIGWILLNSGRPREAVAHLRSVSLERGPLDSRYYTALGIALQELEEYEESLSAFESSLELDPYDANTVQLAAVGALLAEEKAKFNHHAKVARHLGKTDALDRFMAMKKAVEIGAPSSATTGSRERVAPELGVSISHDPGNANAYLRRGMAYFEQGEDDKAISDLDAAIRLDPGNAATYMLRGIVYGYMDQYDRVISNMTEAIRLAPGISLAHYYRGLVYGERDELERAIANLDEAIRLNPHHADAYRARGDCCRYMQEYDRAITDFDTALRLDPDEAISYRGRGAAYRMKREFDRAISDFDAALRLNPKDSFAYRFRGDAYVATENFGQAISDFDVALSIDPDDEVAYCGRGDAYLFSGNFELAIANYNAAVECDPSSGPAYHNRGLARELMGDPDGASEDYRRARELGYDDSA